MKKRVDAISDDDLDHRVTFSRPPADIGPRIVIGRLTGVRPTKFPSGKPGYMIWTDRGGSSSDGGDQWGPVPATFEIDVQGKWVERKPIPWEQPPVWPPHIKRIRVMFLGGTMDGKTEDIGVDDFGSTNIYRHDPEEPEVTLIFRQHTALQQVKGALYWGKWRLEESIDKRKAPEEMYTTYNWGDTPTG